MLGVAFAITADDHAHVELTEGVAFGNYRRVELPVEPLVPRDAPATAFSLSSDRRDPALRPSTRYMALVIEGALEHGCRTPTSSSCGRPGVRGERRVAALRPMLDELFKRR